MTAASAVAVRSHHANRSANNASALAPLDELARLGPLDERTPPSVDRRRLPVVLVDRPVSIDDDEGDIADHLRSVPLDGGGATDARRLADRTHPARTGSKMAQDVTVPGE
jgi:hypothetical protein